MFILKALFLLLLSLNLQANHTPLSKTYDAMDNLLSETNQEGETTTYEYDGADSSLRLHWNDPKTVDTFLVPYIFVKSLPDWFEYLY